MFHISYNSVMETAIFFVAVIESETETDSMKLNKLIKKSASVLKTVLCSS